MNPTDTASEIVAALMWQPQTVDTLVEATGASKTAVQRWLTALHRSGAIYIHGEHPNPAQGRMARIWALQTQPYSIADYNPRKVQRLTVDGGVPDDAPGLDTAQLAAEKTPASSAESTNPATA